MKRRQILGYTAGVAVLSAMKPVLANGFVEYTAEAYNQELASGNPFMLGFLSSW